MNTQNALQILINAVQQANQKGAFTLQDSKIIAEAVEVFVKPQTPPTTDEMKKSLESKPEEKVEPLRGKIKNAPKSNSK